MAGGAADTLTDAKKNWLYERSCRACAGWSRSCSSNRTGRSGSSRSTCPTHQLYPLLYEHLDDRAIYRNAVAYSLLAQPLPRLVHRAPQVAERPAQGMDGRPGHGEANRKVLGDIVARWYPRASEAVRTYAGGSPSLPARPASWARPSGASRSWPRR